MLARTLFGGVVTLLTILSTGCCCHKRCCVPVCCPTTCCYQPASYNAPATFSPMAARDLPQIKLASDSSR